MPETKRFPELEPEREEELEEEDAGIASLFGKLIAQKLKGGKKRFAEVD